MAPRLIRFAETPKTRMPDEADEHRERDDGGDDQRGAHVAQEQEEHDDDEQAALEQVACGRCAMVPSITSLWS